MRKLKSALALLITLLLLCPSVAPLALAAEEADVAFTMEGSPSVVGAGDQIKIPVVMASNKSGIITARAFIDFDPEQLTYKSVDTSESDFNPSLLSGRGLTVTNPKAGRIYFTFGNPLATLEDDPTVITGTGVIATLLFTVAEDYEGEMNIKLSLSEKDVWPENQTTAGDEITIKAIDFSTHEHTYDEGKWESDENDHWQICTECGRESEHKEHVPGPDATEETAQTCTVCGRVLVEKLGHQCKLHLNKVERKEPTCTATGNIEYWECSEDHKKYRDQNAEEFVADDAVILQMIPHTPSEQWYSDETDHWHICTVCKAVLDETKTSHTPDGEWHTDGTNHWHVCTECQKELGKTAHTPDNEWHSDETGHWHVCMECDEVLGKTAHNPGPDATEENPQTCTECNYVIVQALGHQCKNHLDKVERKEPTCTATGNIEYWECREDHKKYRDPNAEEFLEDDAVILQMIPHTPDNEWHSDETGHWHVCTVCKTVLEETKTSHTPDGEWHTDETGHWHVCTECQKEFGKTDHTPDGEWHTDENDHWHVCTACNAVLDKHEHTPGPEATEEAPQTCTDCGYELAPKLEPKYLLGDINNDGVVDSTDYLLLKRVMLGTYKLTDEQALAADINQDGTVDSSDYLLLKRVMLGTYKIA